MEPVHLRPKDWNQIRVPRLAARMLPWLDEPNIRLIKATLSPSSPSHDASAPDRVIGHALWTLPQRTKSEIISVWRRDASDLFGWKEKMGWTQEFEDELWSSVDVDAWQNEEFVLHDRVREGYLKGIGHW